MVSTTPTMSSSVNGQKVTGLEALVNLLQCRRRKNAIISPPSQKHAASQGALKKHPSANLDDSDDTQKSTDISVSTREPSSDGSELDSPSSLKVGRKDANMIVAAARSPPGLGISPPPGLEAPPGLENPTLDCSNRAKGARLSSKANLKAFAPVSRYPKNQLSESVDESPLSALKEAITKLSTQDASVVRSFLLAKEGEQKTAPMQLNRNVMNAHALRDEDCQRARVYNSRPMESSWQDALNDDRSRMAAQARSRMLMNVRKRKPSAREQVVAENAEKARTNLRDLAAFDPERVVMLRKIHKLGFDSAPALEAYFSKFGTIDRLMVTPTSCHSTSGAPRPRPASFGYVVMSTVEEAKAAKALGEERVVQGIDIIVADLSFRV